MLLKYLMELMSYIEATDLTLLRGRREELCWRKGSQYNLLICITLMSEIFHNRLVDVTISILYTISMSGEVQEFRSRIPNRLQGPGILFRSNDRAYFQKFLVDTTVGFTVVNVVFVLPSLQCRAGCPCHKSH